MYEQKEISNRIKKVENTRQMRLKRHYEIKRQQEIERQKKIDLELERQTNLDNEITMQLVMEEHQRKIKFEQQQQINWENQQLKIRLEEEERQKIDMQEQVNKVLFDTVDNDVQIVDVLKSPEEICREKLQNLSNYLRKEVPEIVELSKSQTDRTPLLLFKQSTINFLNFHFK